MGLLSLVVLAVGLLVCVVLFMIMPWSSSCPATMGCPEVRKEECSSGRGFFSGTAALPPCGNQDK